MVVVLVGYKKHQQVAVVVMAKSMGRMRANEPNGSDSSEGGPGAASRAHLLLPAAH